MDPAHITPRRCADLTYERLVIQRVTSTLGIKDKLPISLSGHLRRLSVSLSSDTRVRDIVQDTRSKILWLVQEGRVDGIEFDEGNRAALVANQHLVSGPDFEAESDDAHAPVYLPAYLRYTGRCFRATREEWESMYAAAEFPSVLIARNGNQCTPLLSFRASS